MKTAFEKYKGIHPGLILEHELHKRGIPKRQFALSVKEHAQTLNCITKGKRKLTPELSFRIDEALEVGQGTMLFLQAYYEIEEYNRKHKSVLPKGFEKLRKILFWDTNFDAIDWEKQSTAVIKRIFERGNEQEKQAITEYYGSSRINKALSH